MGSGVGWGEGRALLLQGSAPGALLWRCCENGNYGALWVHVDNYDK